MTNRRNSLSILQVAVLSVLSGCMALPSNEEPPRPPVFSLQSVQEPDKFHIFFSVMDYFKHIDVTKALFFLSRDESETFERFPLENATCIENSSFCYITRLLPRINPGQCEWIVTVRGNMIKDTEVCGFETCPNMDTPLNCHLTIVDKLNCKTQSHKTCPSLPHELKVFLPPPGVTEMSSVSIGEPEWWNAGVLIFLLLLAVACIVAITVTCVAIHRWSQSPRYVILIPLADHCWQAGDPPTSGKYFCHLSLKPPEFPSKTDAELVALMPEYSLEALRPLNNFGSDSVE